MARKRVNLTLFSHLWNYYVDDPHFKSIDNHGKSGHPSPVPFAPPSKGSW